jgi:hypothetical protein
LELKRSRLWQDDDRVKKKFFASLGRPASLTTLITRDEAHRIAA